MRNPNGYGSVIYLGKGRRKPYAVRITEKRIISPETKKSKQQYKYLGYYEKSKDANVALAKYNTGMQIKEHVSVSEQPTFDELYKDWIEFKTSRNKVPSQSTLRNYSLAFGWCKKLHGRKFISIRLDDIQEIADLYKDKSQSTIVTIKTVLSQMYEFAIKRELIDKNYASLADWEWVESEDVAHEPFTDREIGLLWENIDLVNVDLVLMMIYTGFRASEFIGLETKNVHLDKRYVVGGIKTDAGKDRMVALNDKALPLFKKYYTRSRKYLIPNSKGTKYSYGVFNISVWNGVMNQLGMNHTPHDTRHTFATLLDRAGANKICIKNLLGHSIQDLTDGTYTHKNLDDLLEAVNLI